MVVCALPHIRYLVRPGGDNTEVRYSFGLISHGPLIIYLGYTLSRGAIGGSPPIFLFLLWYNFPSGYTLRSVSRHDPVCPFLLVFEGNV